MFICHHSNFIFKHCKWTQLVFPFHISAGTPTILKGFMPFLSLSTQMLRKCAAISQYRLLLRNVFHHSMSCSDVSAGIPTRYGLYATGIESRWERGFPRPSRLALGPIRPPVWGVPGLLPGVKRLGRSVDHLPPPSSEVKKIGELYLCFPFGLLWPVIGWNLPLLFTRMA
jgi:hypothetical protein